jgi:putative transposase
VVTPHTAVLGLTSDATQRQCAYRALIIETADSGEIEAIRLHVQRQHAYGTEGFRANIEAMLGRSAGPQKIGRPRKSAAT